MNPSSFSGASNQGQVIPNQSGANQFGQRNFQSNLPSGNQTQSRLPPGNQTQSNFPLGNQTQSRLPPGNQTQSRLPPQTQSRFPPQTQSNLPPNQMQNRAPPQMQNRFPPAGTQSQFPPQSNLPPNQPQNPGNQPQNPNRTNNRNPPDSVFPTQIENLATEIDTNEVILLIETFLNKADDAANSANYSDARLYYYNVITLLNRIMNSYEGLGTHAVSVPIREIIKVCLAKIQVFASMAGTDGQSVLLSYENLRDYANKLISTASTQTGGKSGIPFNDTFIDSDIPNAGAFKVTTNFKLTFDDVKGIDTTVQSIKDIVANQSQANILFFGPPGTGKTFLAQAISGYYKFPLLAIAASDILSGTFGGTEKNISSLFAVARKVRDVKETHIVVFLDEAEQLIAKRGASNGGVDTRGFTNEFLVQLDGANSDTANIIFIFNTNNPEVVDPAILRRVLPVFIGYPYRADDIFSLLKYNLDLYDSQISREAIQAKANYIYENRLLVSPAGYSLFVQEVARISRAKYNQTQYIRGRGRPGGLKKYPVKEGFLPAPLNQSGISEAEIEQELKHPPIFGDIVSWPLEDSDLNRAEISSTISKENYRNELARRDEYMKNYKNVDVEEERFVG